MLTVNIVTIVCLAVLCLELLSVFVNIVAKKRADRIAFLRGFKRGTFALIYVTAIPLYCLGHIYAGKSFLDAFFSAVHKIINLVVLKYETESIALLMSKSELYSVTVYFCFILVGLNAILFTISLVSQHVWEYVQSIRAFFSFKDKLFIIGNNKESRLIYESDIKRSKAIVDILSAESRESLYFDKVSYIDVSSYEKAVERIFRSALKRERECAVIVNTGDDDKNMLICRSFVSCIEGLDGQSKHSLYLKLRISVFGDPRYEAIYDDIVKEGSGCVQYVNKYQKIAMDFIDKYPLASLMTAEQIDYETSLVHRGVNINVIFIGFGKTNQQIFLTSVANNQFLTSKDFTEQSQSGYLPSVLKPVRYHVFDKNVAENNKNLNHNYYRFKNECAGLDTDKYLPLPEYPAEEKYYHLDINDCDFYNSIRSIIDSNGKDAGFIIIAFGSDLENIDMAKKLLEKKREWGIEKLNIFVKARSYHKVEELLEAEGCRFIGNEKDVVYDVEKIMSDKILRMAKMRNEAYDLEYEITHNGKKNVDLEFVKRSVAESDRRWYAQKTQLERESSLYCCLSLRSKLNLIGLDYLPEDSEVQGLTEREYLDIYARTDMPDYEYYSTEVAGRKILRYDLNFKNSLRKTMAVHEHARWNSFMISKGMIPADIEKIKNETVMKNGKPCYTNGRNYLVRRHGNLTTFDGLVSFRKLILSRDGGEEYDKDVIKYDYQILDDAFWLLHKNGYKIVRK